MTKTQTTTDTEAREAEMSFGSLHNQIQGEQQNPAPVVGMGATILMWSDRHAATVVRVVGPKTIDIQQDTAKRVDGNGMSDAQTYEFERNPDAPITRYTLRKTGFWVRKGESMRGGQRVVLGHRSEHYDFSF